MAGDSLRAGSVAAISNVKNPIKLARRVLEDGRHVMLAGEGALRFAREIDFPECAADTLIVESEKNRWDAKHGTVGCVAFDSHGRLAVATSTGGVFNKLPGRVGDSPLIGCGTYADAFGAASCTGYGEAIMRLVLAKSAVDFLRDGHQAQNVADGAIGELAAKLNSTGGIILIDRDGKIGYARNTTHMPVCSVTAGAAIMVAS
jgi:beta-aspartyl-peptidase (threonine type)